jgi:hypothetical protein
VTVQSGGETTSVGAHWKHCRARLFTKPIIVVAAVASSVMTLWEVVKAGGGHRLDKEPRGPDV